MSKRKYKTSFSINQKTRGYLEELSRMMSIPRTLVIQTAVEYFYHDGIVAYRPRILRQTDKRSKRNGTRNRKTVVK